MERQLRRITVIIERQGDQFVAVCPRLDIRREGDSIVEARTRLLDAVQLLAHRSQPYDFMDSLAEEVYVSTIDITLDPDDA